MPKETLEETPFVPAGRFLLEITFDGSGYSGWQIQPHRVAVQEVMQKTLTRLYGGQAIHLIGASRTDAGVHALGFAASYLYPEFPQIPAFKVQSALNRLMPPDIRIAAIREVAKEFHTRYDAVGKAYTYVLNLGPDSPFTARYSWRPARQIDPALIAEGAKHLVGTHDFSSFVVERSLIEDAVRTIYRIDVQQFGQYLCVTFVGSGFLYKMIRCLMGALEAVGAGKIPPERVAAILEAKDRTQAPETAPPCGLFLDKVFFDPAELEAFRLDGVPFFR